MDEFILKVIGAIFEQGLPCTLLAVANIVQFNILRSLAGKYEDCLKGIVHKKDKR